MSQKKDRNAKDRDTGTRISLAGATVKTRIKSMPEHLEELDKIRRANEEDDKHTFASGAKSSRKEFAFDMIPREGLEYSAVRFLFGKEVRGFPKHNWKQGKDDPDFVADRVNHLIHHLLNLVTGDYTIEDIQAIAWAGDVIPYFHAQGTGLATAFPQNPKFKAKEKK